MPSHPCTIPMHPPTEIRDKERAEAKKMRKMRRSRARRRTKDKQAGAVVVTSSWLTLEKFRAVMYPSAFWALHTCRQTHNVDSLPRAPNKYFAHAQPKRSNASPPKSASSKKERSNSPAPVAPPHTLASPHTPHHHTLVSPPPPDLNICPHAAISPVITTPTHLSHHHHHMTLIPALTQRLARS